MSKRESVVTDQIVHEYDYEQSHVTPVLSSLFDLLLFSVLQQKSSPVLHWKLQHVVVDAGLPV